MHRFVKFDCVMSLHQIYCTFIALWLGYFVLAIYLDNVSPLFFVGNCTLGQRPAITFTFIPTHPPFPSVPVQVIRNQFGVRRPTFYFLYPSYWMPSATSAGAALSHVLREDDHGPRCVGVWGSGMQEVRECVCMCGMGRGTARRSGVEVPLQSRAAQGLGTATGPPGELSWREVVSGTRGGRRCPVIPWIRKSHPRACAQGGHGSAGRGRGGRGVQDARAAVAQDGWVRGGGVFLHEVLWWLWIPQWSLAWMPPGTRADAPMQAPREGRVGGCLRHHAHHHVLTTPISHLSHLSLAGHAGKGGELSSQVEGRNAVEVFGLKKKYGECAGRVLLLLAALMCLWR